MSENAGRIWYEFGVETTDVLKAQTVTTKATDSMSNSFKKVDNSVKNFNAQTTKASQGVRRAFGSNLGQAGIQIQQFAGQLQGGQSAMVALAQQSADLGIVLGAPLIGVFVSLAAVLAGTLAPAIFGSVSNIEKLQKAIENTKAIMTVGADGVAKYTDEIKKLNTASENLAKIKIALAMTQNAQAMSSARKEALALGAELIGFQEYAEDAAKRLTGLTSKTGEILNITGAMRNFNAATSDDKKLKALDQAEKALLNMRKNGVFPTKELSEYASEFFTFSDAVRQTIASNAALAQSQESLSESNSISADSFKDMKNALLENIIELKSGEKAALKWSLLMSGLDANQQAEILTLYDKKEALEATNRATEEAAKANEKYEESVRRQTESDLEWFNQQEKLLEQQENRKKGKAEGFAQGIIDRGMTEPERFAAELEELQVLREQGLINQQLYDQAVVASVENRAAQMERANEKSMQSQALFNSSQAQLLGSLSSLVGEYANNMEVNDKKSFEKKKKFQKAQALINTAMAISNALAAAPPPINFALAAASGAMGAIQVSAIQNQQYSGGRQYGGPVSNGMYRVNETGIPEVYSQGGKDYLMNTKNANITPLDKAQGGGGGMSVEVNNYTPYQVFVTRDEAAGIAKVEIGNESKKASQGRGVLYQGLSKGTNVKNNARR